MGSGFEISAEDIRVFLDEAEELLQTMEGGILRLETDDGDPEVIQEVFRAAHTLKGSSATLGHQRMAELTHAMENVLDKLRKGKLAVTTELADTLFNCLDVLKAFKDEIASGEPARVNTEEVMRRLAALDGSGGAGAAPAAGAPAPQGAAAPVAEAAPKVPPLTPAQQEQVKGASARGLMACWAEIQLAMDAAMPAVRAFQALLAVGDFGEIVLSVPSQEQVEADQIDGELKILFLSREAPERVREALAQVPEITVRTLVPYVPGSPAPAAQVAAAVAAPAPEVVAAGANGAAAPGANGAASPAAAGDNGAAPKSSKSGLRTVRVDVEVLDNLMNTVGELVIERTRLQQVLSRLEVEREGDELSQVMSSALAQIGRLTGNLQEEIQRARMLPVDNLFRKFPRMMRDVAQKAGKEIQFVMKGEETELDRSVIEEIGDPLMHLLRNAVDHGIEPPAERLAAGKPAAGTVILEAYHEENHIIISVRDDGRGVDPDKVRASAVRKGLLSEEAARRLPDPEAVNLIWAPGFSTAEKVSDISGRGVGLDVVQKNIEKINGSVEIHSKVGEGTEFRVKLPLTLAIIRALQVDLLGTTYCIPLGSVVETDRIPTAEIRTVRQREVIVKRGEVIPLLRLAQVFELERPEGAEEPEEIFVVIVAVMGRQIGLVVDSLVGEGDVVIKPLGRFIGEIPGISGATIMGDGDVAIILDVPSLVSSVQEEAVRLEAVAR
ncbi:two-component system chemotaxis sensor kinase CheA [Symbiobacterium terraclitae]|uniref:Chemotaxis protein CheA n=1 Tax=Symbiobacterium terraclitae TaxID=557451 RepID=A0ABS4JT50_9FIRM|nr:chemotaxis protein CheA [Symbiobacterium terraclitae]MBP2017644.1 two-component system chemotaxis sensor kinase CheA [Symbiobacterium terraclitae]